ncbi:MAG: hypothetical protein ATN32_04445 [Candidatus Epulonipiscium fishelsonii]|nr:MAG: hypothetical protein ATN32_04445 [Epulopiscium sp. AS2M-Bin002]
MPLTLQFRDLHSPGVAKYTINIYQTQRDEYHSSSGAIKPFSTNAVMIFHILTACKSSQTQQPSNSNRDTLTQLETRYLVKASDDKTHKKIMKCDMCQHREDGPMCVEKCPMQAITLEEVV